MGVVIPCEQAAQIPPARKYRQSIELSSSELPPRMEISFFELDLLMRPERVCDDDTKEGVLEAWAKHARAEISKYKIEDFMVN